MSHQHNVSIKAHKDRIRDAGYKLTRARVTVLQVIHELDEHCTSADILDAVATIDESVGRASVFRTLDLLTGLNIIRPTYVDTSQTPRYVMMPDGHHHHVICTHCNQIFEFADCGLSDLTRELEENFNLEITGHLLEFYAKCATCAAKDQ